MGILVTGIQAQKIVPVPALLLTQSRTDLRRIVFNSSSCIMIPKDQRGPESR